MIRRDCRFSEEGDLELGSQKINSNGELLYINNFGVISTDPSAGTPLRDIALHSQRNVIKQNLRGRLKTDNPDWFHHDEIGANLSDLIGEPNTKTTGLKGAEAIKASISYGNYIGIDNINVRPVPVNHSTILFYIELKDNSGLDIEYPVLFDLESGILTEYEIPKKEE